MRKLSPLIVILLALCVVSTAQRPLKATHTTNKPDLLTAGAVNVRIDPQKSQTHRDRYPDTKGDGKTRYVVVIMASLIYQHNNNLTAMIHNDSWIKLYKNFKENSYKYKPYKKGIEFESTGQAPYWRVSEIYPVYEEDVWDLIDQVDKLTDADDRIALIWVSHGYYDSNNKIGALGLYNHYVDSTGSLQGDYIDSYELANIFRILGPALDFVWVIACQSANVLVPDKNDPQLDHPIWALTDVGVVAYGYEEDIVFSPYQSVSDIDRQISDFVSYVFMDNRSVEETIVMSKRQHSSEYDWEIWTWYDLYIGKASWILSNLDEVKKAIVTPGKTRGEAMYILSAKGFMENSYGLRSSYSGSFLFSADRPRPCIVFLLL